MKRTLAIVLLVLTIIGVGVLFQARAGDITPQAITPYDLYEYLAEVKMPTGSGIFTG